MVFLKIISFIGQIMYTIIKDITDLFKNKIDNINLK